MRFSTIRAFLPVFNDWDIDPIALLKVHYLGIILNASNSVRVV
jgi:hypothetical protein